MEEIVEHGFEVAVLGDLADEEADHPVTHDEVVRARHLRQRPVPQVEHLGHDRDVEAVALFDVPQVEERDDRPRIGALDDAGG